MGKNSNNPTEQSVNAETQQPPITTKEDKKKEEAITKAAEIWATELRTPSWQLAALKQHMKLAEGKMLSEKEFTDGIRNAVNQPVGR